MVVQLKQKGEREGAEAPRKAIHIRLRQKGKASQDGDSRRAFVAVVIVKLSRNHLQGRVWEAETPRKDCAKPPRCNTHPHKGYCELGAGRACCSEGRMLPERTLSRLFTACLSCSSNSHLRDLSQHSATRSFSHLHRLFP